jgi:hypothetical protein
MLSARKKGDLLDIETACNLKGTVVIDDFHRLDEGVQRQLTDLLKILADEERADIKLVLVGINKAGDSLINLAADLNTRVEAIQLKPNPFDSVVELVEKGEKALGVRFVAQRGIASAAEGSFCLAQMLCHEACLAEGILEGNEEIPFRIVSANLTALCSHVCDTLARPFMPLSEKLATGLKLHREGRAPYLHILKWLAESEEWSVSLDREIAKHPELRDSVRRLIEENELDTLLARYPELRKVVHYMSNTTVFSAEDPAFAFFLRNLPWQKFAERLGYLNVQFEGLYDFALSFAGSDRPIAKRLYELLAARGFEVFYDENDQHLIAGKRLEDYLAPIYKTQATFVVCLLGREYPERVWTKFESEQFKERFGEGAVIPIRFADVPVGMFDRVRDRGWMVYRPAANFEEQLTAIAEVLRRKMAERAHAREARRTAPSPA